MQTTTLKSDQEIKNDVLSELKYEPAVKTTDIGVLVKDRTVTLNGDVTSYGEKRAAVLATKRVAGVRAVADNIEVKFPQALARTDGAIATAAANHLEWESWTVPAGCVQVTVSDGWITLEGQVEWQYQKEAAEHAVHGLSGVNGVFNSIVIKPKVDASNVKAAILSAFERNALVDGAGITVSTVGSKVTLTGNVRNHAERDEAVRIAWAAPGVLAVENKVTVEWL